LHPARAAVRGDAEFLIRTGPILSPYWQRIPTRPVPHSSPIRIPFWRSVRARLSLLALGVAVLLAALFWLRAVERRRAEERQLTARAAELVSVAARAFDTEVRQMKAFLVAVSARIDPREAPARNAVRMREILEDSDAPIVNLLLFDSTGHAIATARPFLYGKPLWTPAELPKVREVLRTGVFTPGDVVRARVLPDSARAMMFLQPLLDSVTGRVRAIVSGLVPLDSLQGAQVARTLPPGSVVTVLDSTGTVLVRTLDPDGWIGRNFGDRPGVRDNLRFPEGVDISQSDDGTFRLIGFKRSKTTGWINYVGIPASQTVELARAQFLRDLIGALLIAVLLLALALWLALRIVRPIESLTADARAIAAGDSSRRSTVQSSDELGVLATAFNSMADAAAERQAMERALAESRDQLRQAQKMEALGSFAGGMAHDFNNYLASITGYAQLAAEQVPEDSQAYEDIKEIIASALRAGDLTRQILVFSRRQVIEPTLLDVGDVVMGVQRLLAPLMGETITLATSLQHGASVVRADRHQLEQVIVNLAANARDAMPTGGLFTLSTRAVTLTGEDQAHPGVRAGRWVVIAATDTGTGIADDVRARIFEPFFTTKERGRGTGLGLALVYSIVQQADGVLRVESEVGRGTTIHVYLPLVEGAVITPTGAPAIRSVEGGGEQVLVVEDEQSVRNMTVAVLTRAGYRVHAVPNAEEALRYLTDRTHQVDIMLSDVVMPGMHGPELAARVRGMYPVLPILLMSGYADDEQMAATVQKAGVQFLAKPFTAEALLSRLRQLLNRTAVIP
jgi:signal transduction histidine kinase/ActR/RegA family two-component response regulator